MQRITRAFLIQSQQAYRFASKQSDQEIKSIPGHKPPAYEDTVQGKYAGVLFSVASQSENLHDVLEDMKFFKELAQTSEAFRNFLLNSSFSREQQRAVIESLGKDTFSVPTANFLNTLIENQRIQFLPKVADKYIEYYKILNKEENITIISAKELTSEERQKVVEALKKQNPSVQFTVQYKTDASILGGLQMYSGNRFLDCSLLSRVNKIRAELSKLSV